MTDANSGALEALVLRIQRRDWRWTRLAFGGVAAVALLSGCQSARSIVADRPAQKLTMTPAELENRAEEVRANPRAYLERVAAKTEGLDQYTLEFVRQERRGLLQTLQPAERIQAWFRREPFSVRMKWFDKDVKYDETTYVAGQFGDKVRFVTRWWTPPLKAPPGINAVDLQTPVIWGESKRPLTDFGLERMMARTLASFDEAGGDVIVQYDGLKQLTPDGPPVHHLHIEYPATKFRVPIQELYIDAASDLPAGTVLRRANDDLDAAYFYDDVNTEVHLTDADFLLSVERGGGDEPQARDARKAKSP